MDPEELRLFEENYEKDNEKYHKQYNEEWKKAKKEHKITDEYQEAENRERRKRNENH